MAEATSPPTALWEVRRGHQPLLATAIHDGHEVRGQVAALLALDDATRRREEDPYTSCWVEVAENRIVPRRSRFEVDLNRPRDAAVYRTPADAWGLDVWRHAPPAELVDASLATYDAFYAELEAILRDLEAIFGRFAVLDLHSYNHRRGGPGAPPADAVANPVVNVGTGNLDRVRWGPLVDRFVADLRAQEVAGEPLRVGENVRFRGGHLARWVTSTFPETGCPLAIEVKKVYMDEWTGEPDHQVIGEVRRALAATVPGLLSELALR